MREVLGDYLACPLVCASGVCLSCSFETHSGVKVICRDGPVFDLREVARSVTI
ncbi:MAG: hypothetical protein E6J48_08665 [Chloroflexi bacterium]|nr:MAG: hypothetical protein E6J48_08665 [Chloroflexota bacterium]